MLLVRPAIAGALLLIACRSASNSPAASNARHAAPALAPDEVALVEEQAAAELSRWQRERDERLVDVVDPGEQAEHAGLVKQADNVTTRRAVLPVSFATFAAAAGSNGIGYLVANDQVGPPANATAYVFDPACAP